MFCKSCGAEINDKAVVCVKCGVPTIKIGGKNKTIAALLALFLGGIGIHKFYLGRWIQGFLYLIFSFTFIPLILSFFECIYYLLMSEDKFNSTYY